MNDRPQTPRAPTRGERAKIVVLAGFFLVATGAYQAITHIRLLDKERVLLWLFHYDGEFIRRALVGTLLKAQAPDAYGEISVIYGLTLGSLILLFGLLCLYFVLVIWRAPRLRTAALVALFGISPFTFAFFAYDVGQPDKINYVLALLTLLFCLAVKNDIARLVVVITVSLVGLLIHESFALVQFPLLLAVLLLGASNPGRETARRTALAVSATVPVLTLCGLVALYGQPDAFTEDAYRDRLETQVGFEIDRVGAMAPKGLYSTLSDNMAATYKFWFEPAWQVGAVALFKVLIALIAWCALPLWISASSLRQLRAGHDHDRRFAMTLILFGSLGPLLLCAVTWDYGRWTSFAVVNTSLLAGFLLICEARYGIATQDFDLLTAWHQASWRRVAGLCIVALALVVSFGARDSGRINEFRPFALSSWMDEFVTRALPESDMVFGLPGRGEF